MGKTEKHKTSFTYTFIRLEVTKFIDGGKERKRIVRDPKQKLLLYQQSLEFVNQFRVRISQNVPLCDKKNSSSDKWAGSYLITRN